MAINTQTLPDYSPSIQRFTRSVRLREYFQEDMAPDKIPPFKRKSTWQPPKASPDVEHYLSSLTPSLSNITTRKHSPNLDRGERAALKELKSADIVIRNADKGSCVVIENRSTYIQDGLAHLSDASIYEQINEDYTSELTKAINDYSNLLLRKGQLTDEMQAFLKADPASTRTQQLYFL